MLTSGRRRLPEKRVEKSACPTTPAPPFPVRGTTQGSTPVPSPCRPQGQENGILWWALAGLAVRIGSVLFAVAIAGEGAGAHADAQHVAGESFQPTVRRS